VEALGHDVGDAVLVLQRAADLQEACREGRHALRRKHPRPENHVDDAGLVLEREEHHAGGGAGLLQVSDEAADPHPRAIGQGAQLQVAAESQGT
jgi:hypothetical protein